MLIKKEIELCRKDIVHRMIVLTKNLKDGDQDLIKQLEEIFESLHIENYFPLCYRRVGFFHRIFSSIKDFFDKLNLPPDIDFNLHHFSENAKLYGNERYDKILSLNRNFEDKQILEKYASLVKNSVQSYVMYMETTERTNDRQEVINQATYWMKWTEYYKKRNEKIKRKHNFIID